MTVKTMTMKEIKSELLKMSPQDKKLERLAMQQEPNLTDLDAPPMSADMIPFISRPGRKNSKIRSS